RMSSRAAARARGSTCGLRSSSRSPGTSATACASSATSARTCSSRPASSAASNSARASPPSATRTSRCPPTPSSRAPPPPLRAADQLAVLLQQLTRLSAGLVGLLERLPDPRPPLVDQLLDRAEGIALQHEQRDQEAENRPDHQPRRDLDQRIRGEEHQTRT